ncbi:MAG: alpha/beta hydrolase [Cryomorphaceae bacterium]
MAIIIYVLIGILAVYGMVCAFYFLFQDRLIFVPAWPHKKGELLLASDYEDVEFETPNDGWIHAVHIKTDNPRGCVLYFHGNTGNILRWAPIAEELTSYGFDVFLPDYRGYGKSKGKRTERNLFNDAEQCYREVLKRYPEEKICIYGRSLGSAMACWLSARTNPGAIVLETPFVSLIHVASYQSKIIPVKLFLKYRFRNNLYLRHATSPVLIAHGTKDNLVPYKSGLRLYQLIRDKENTDMLTIPGGKHGNLNGFPILRQKLTQYFDRYFPTK